MRLRGLALIATLYLICQVGPMSQPANAQSFMDSIIPGQVVSPAVYNLLPPQLRALVRVAGQAGGNPALNARGLPPTNLDSFVYQAGGRAEDIYGDEGVNGLPPIDSFTSQNRINSGIFGTRNAGLTTGHGSIMPAAWGGDEYCHGTEWVRTGDQGGNQLPYYVPTSPFTAGGILNSVTTGLGVGTERPGEMPAVRIADPSINYDRNAPDFIRNFGMWATAVVPYAVTPGMRPVQNTQTNELMGWMAPGESVSDFLSGRTGRLLPSQQGAAAGMLNQLNGQQSTFTLPSTSSPVAGF